MDHRAGRRRAWDLAGSGAIRRTEDAAAEIEANLDPLDGRFSYARLWLGELLTTYRQSAAEMARQESDRDIDR